MSAITSDRTREQRAQDIENALASVRMEGQEPSEEAKAVFQKYVDGDVTLEEMGRAIDQLLDEKYGPVRQPGNERS
jgi:hypothetical protein